MAHVRFHILQAASRRADRLFGDMGRTKTLSSRVKHEKLGVEYDPRYDTCIQAFVRLMAQAASISIAVESEA